MPVNVNEMEWFAVPTARRTSKSGWCDIRARIAGEFTPSNSVYFIANYVSGEVAEEMVRLHNAGLIKKRVKLDNGKAYDKGKSIYSHTDCCVCGKPLTVAQRRLWLLISRAGDGSVEYVVSGVDGISVPGDCMSPGEGPNVYAVPIGSDCLKRHPEYRIGLMEVPEGF